MMDRTKGPECRGCPIISYIARDLGLYYGNPDDCHLTLADFEAIRGAIAGEGRLVLQVRSCRTCVHIGAAHDGPKLNAWCAKHRLWSEKLPDECSNWQPKEA
jgi:hypothetical protein